MGAAKPRPLIATLTHSFTLKLFLLAFALLSVPLVLYWQFVNYSNQQAVLIHNAIEQTNSLAIEVLRPHLLRFHDETEAQLQEALAHATVGGARVKLLLRPTEDSRQNFFYITAYPPVSRDYLRQEQEGLIKAGIFSKLAPTCDQASDLSIRFTNPAGNPEILTSFTPVHVQDNCWVVITSKNASSFSDGLPETFMQSGMMKFTGSIYILSTALIIWLFVHLWRNVSRFRRAARTVRLRKGGQASFKRLNTIPELAGVAEDFDYLVGALLDSQDFIRHTAEENAHALKAPLAVIAQAIEPIKRAVPSTNESGQRGIYFIERSIQRLDSIVSSARAMEEAAADVIYPERQLMNISKCVGDLLETYEGTLSMQQKQLRVRLTPDVFAYANEEIMESILENLLENAASFTPEHETIDVLLRHDRKYAYIKVADRGPGVAPQNLDYIFDRYVSFRPANDEHSGNPSPSDSHQGIGLWIVKRNVEGLGGIIKAVNRHDGGFAVTVQLRKYL